jgi:hypothetical protein
MPESIEIKIPTAVKLTAFLNYVAAFSSIVIIWSLFNNPAGSYLSFNSNLHTFFLGPAGSLLFIIYFGSGFIGGGLTPYFIALAMYCSFVLYIANGLQNGNKFTQNIQKILSSIFIFFSALSIVLSITSIFDSKFYISIYWLTISILIYLVFNKNDKVNDFFSNREQFKLQKFEKIKLITLSISYLILSTLIILYFNNRSQDLFELNKASNSNAIPEQEMVMNKGMKIAAATTNGKIEISAEDSFIRTYSWGSCVRTQTLFPRKKRWYGSLGAYFPGPNPSWKLCEGIDGSLLEEGQMHFNTVDEAMLWINSGSKFEKGTSVYNNDGLLVNFSKSIHPSGETGILKVNVWQIYINGSKPNGLNGSDDSKITIEK